ncbi:probable GTP-binding protein OBGM, mitochondrial isoform X1 [Ziziphus jujuba]|uniref:Probable GTP-binding protein OBGM, mitochondrial isoform X1 n=5 Tax=Ziziphus jujuba TaxID=326968 RepID=A0A6P3Z8B0_ZIZJJ|nr:probable GTP-binding protein OBGM, mitochondrial isoform X1 [Ziziphus jujuba]XP_015874099.3 probable GTP-binding protein OBGM, mitochondrial isoform X1 [Ziziphus jujuba]XP_015874100.3 probable GTP-binding protein OBGM, mitochondrial isoform X1 [Ziziphus jujuba]XP_024926939.3 probable GTP-binding protein OBGM, mitochondrial isoform X1 [Ziziphus jujuba]
MLAHYAKSLQHLKAVRQCFKPPWVFLTFSSYSDSPPKKSKLAPLQERRMIDRFKLYAKGGDGGNGCSSFRRSRHDRRGVPDGVFSTIGGNGGRGGDVILECSPTVWDFSGLQHHCTANRGGHGASKDKIGTRGADKVVQVPVGTVIHLVKGEIPCPAENSNHSSTDLDPWEIPGRLVSNVSGSCQEPVLKAPSMEENTCGLASHNERNMEEMTRMDQTTHVASPVIHSQFSTPKSCMKEEIKEEQEMQYNVAELTERGQRAVVAFGGEGGLGNVSINRGSRKPRITNSRFQRDNAFALEAPDDDQSLLSAGFPGSEAILVLELKSIADVSLVGMPNAGKSTLLGAISRAKPSVGHYAFTTLRPNLGNLNYDDLSITVADVPGLIKGAHENRGLGHAFLRHIERTKVLAYVVDLAAALDGRKGIPPWQQLRDLVLELEYHQEGLSDRPCLIVANKIDEEGADRVYEELKTRVQDVPIFPVCAVLEEGIPELKDGLRRLMDGQMLYRLKIDKIMVN